MNTFLFAWIQAHIQEEINRGNSTAIEAMEALKKLDDEHDRYKKTLMEIREKCPADGIESAWAIATGGLWP